MKGDRVGSGIQWRMHLPVPPMRVFEALSSNDGRAAFWAESAVELGGRIEFRFVDGRSCVCEILEHRPPHVFCVDYMGGPARFEITPDGRGGTDLLLTHEGVDPDEWQEVHAGWLNVLFPLKAWLAHGVDLRNHDPDRSWDRGFADQ